jgi:hypothetical protein
MDQIIAGGFIRNIRILLFRPFPVSALMLLAFGFSRSLFDGRKRINHL